MITTVTLNPAVDKTVYVSKLTPHDTNRILRVETDAGGKGINCARMLKRLGAETAAVAFLGGAAGDFIETVLAREGVPLHRIETSRPTRNCIAIEEEQTDQPPTTLNEKGGPIDHSELVAMFEKTKELARRSTYVVFGGSIPLGVNDDVYNVLVQIASNAKAKSVLDADGELLAEGIKAKPFMVKPNLEEAERLLNVTCRSKADVARAALRLAEMGVELVVISLGKHGAIACCQGVIYDAVPPDVQERSTIGSGDSMVAGMVFALERGMSIEEALRLGCAAGAATAMSSGADIGSREDVDRLVNQVRVKRMEPSRG
ncbi:MAG: 1-phosphofructokinase [Armatimonadota bacterium]|nr:1-phosphofructokinase [Armatimonadota bacterium]